MRSIFYWVLLSVSLLYSVVLYGQQQTGKLSVKIAPVFNDIPLRFDGQNYINEHGDTLSISLLKFYVSKINLVKAFSHEAALVKDVHLFDSDDSVTNTFQLTVPLGAYDSICFLVGVDSIDNTSGALSGDLDPAKGMYWAWNSGYIMAKLEGTSNVCATLHHAFEFHIGGYKAPYNAVRLITLPLKKRINVISAGNYTLQIQADIAEWFSNNIDLATINSVLIPGNNAMLAADRYKKMFKITE